MLNEIEHKLRQGFRCLKLKIGGIDFDAELDLEEKDDYVVYDTDYKKLVSASEVFEKRRKLSEDERKIRVAIEVALRADKVLFEKFMAVMSHERVDWHISKRLEYADKIRAMSCFDEAKAMYNKVYHKTSFSIWDLFK